MSIIKNEKGTIFITVSFVIIVIFIMISMILLTTTTELRISKVNADGNIAYSLAQSGIEKGMAYITTNPSTNYNETISTGNNSFVYNKDYTFTWSVNFNNLDNRYTVTSNSLYGNSKRSITRIVTLSPIGKIILVK